jgi:hypothetical protein
VISTQTMKYLIANKIKDAEILWENNRFPASVYIAGYAVEIALKYKICKTLQFNLGFPETRQELSGYFTHINNNYSQPLIIDINDIRTHNLNKLLIYSGIELKIQNDFFIDWRIVTGWNPENRYKKLMIFGKSAHTYLKAAIKIIKEVN